MVPLSDCWRSTIASANRLRLCRSSPTCHGLCLVRTGVSAVWLRLCRGRLATQRVDELLGRNRLGGIAQQIHQVRDVIIAEVDCGSILDQR